MVGIIPTVIPSTIVGVAPAPSQAPAVPSNVTVIVGRVPAIPRVVPSIIVPIVGVAQAEATIACQTGRIGEVTVVKAIVVTIRITFIVIL
jgi:hypothetical protein